MFVLQLLAICKSAPAPNVGPTLYENEQLEIGIELRERKKKEAEHGSKRESEAILTQDDSKWHMVF